MKLLVVNPEKTLLETTVTLTELPGMLGRFVVLPSHAPLISSLTEGVVRYVLQDDEDTEHRLPIRGGFVEVKDNVITVCAD